MEEERQKKEEFLQSIDWQQVPEVLLDIIVTILKEEK